MKIPKKFKLFQHEIEVILDKDLHNKSNNWGEAKFREKKIYIDNNIANDFKEQTFLHELIHLIFDYLSENDFSNNEKLVNNISELLYQAIETMEY